MTVTLQLSAEEATALRRTAEAAGVDMDAVLHQLIALLAMPEEASGKEAGAAQKAMEWAEEAEEEAERQRAQEEMQANIRRWHSERAAAP